MINSQASSGCFGAAGDRPGEAARPGERLAALGHRRRGHSEVEIRARACDEVEDRVAIDLHRHLAGKERVQLAALESGREGVDRGRPAQGIVHSGHPLQGAENGRLVQETGPSILAQEAPAVLPSIQIEPRVAIVGHETHLRQVAAGIATGHPHSIVLQFVPGARGDHLAGGVDKASPA